MNSRWRASALAVLAGIGIVLGGCSKSPLAPGDPALSLQTSTPPPVAMFAPDGSLGYVWAPVAADAGGAQLSSPLLPRAVSGSAKIDGCRGGTVHAGRFTVKLPAGAFAGLATVTLSMPDSMLVLCDLAISPPSANRFRVPAQLTADLTAPGVDASTFTVYWFDPVNLVWVSQLANCKVSGTTVTASLGHFSKYCAGKAGW